MHHTSDRSLKHVELRRPTPHLAEVRFIGDGRFNLMSYAMLHELWAVANRIQEDREIRENAHHGDARAKTGRRDRRTLGLGR
jgi:hypothetical protein